jgi:hypothetical protein
VCRCVCFIEGVSFRYRLLFSQYSISSAEWKQKIRFTFRPDFAIITPAEYAPVAQLDRVTDSDSVGQRFESARAYHEKTCREAGFFAVRRGFEVYPRKGKSSRAALIGERQRNGRRWVGSEACFSVLPSLCWRWYAPPDERRTSAAPCSPYVPPRNPRFPTPGTEKKGRCTPRYLSVAGRSRLG